MVGCVLSCLACRISPYRFLLSEGRSSRLTEFYSLQLLEVIGRLLHLSLPSPAKPEYYIALKPLNEVIFLRIKSLPHHPRLWQRDYEAAPEAFLPYLWHQLFGNVPGQEHCVFWLVF